MVSIFYKKPNNRRSLIIREMERKRKKNGKRKLASPMVQYGSNDSQQSHEKNKR